MRPLAKVCGLKTREAVEAAAEGRASHIGFVFYPPSPRAVSPEQAAALGDAAPAAVARVGVFVDPEPDLLAAAIRTAGLDVIQLHGSESPERVMDVRARFGLPVWRGLGVRTSADIDDAARFRTAADLLLFDAKAPTPAGPGQAPLPGGNGLRFDWRLLAGRDVGQRWGLSGGLDAGNVAEAIASVQPALVDVSSGVEESPGVKSVAKIRAFLKAVHQA